MKVLTFLPLTRNRSISELSYYCESELEIGSLYEIPIRNSIVPAILVSANDASELKSSLRSKTYNLKLLDEPKKILALSPGFVAAAEAISNQYASSINPILKNWLGHEYLLENTKLDLSKKNKQSTAHFWQTQPEELGLLIERLQRSNNSNVVCLVSDKNQARMCEGLLGKFKPVVIKGSTKKSSLKNSIDKNLIIATRSFGPIMTLLRKTIVIINPGGEAWRETRWPHFHWDKATKEIACKLGNPTYVWSPVLDSESWLEHKSTKLAADSNISDRYLRNKDKQIKVIERSTGHKNNIDVIFDIEAQHLIKQNLEHNQKTLLYVTRKGLYPVLVCQDCKHLNYTKAFKAQMQQYQLNTTITDWIDPSIAQEWSDRCEKCSSWRLQPVSLSLEQTKNALLEIIPSNKLCVIDTVNQTSEESKKTIKQFESGPETFLLTTQRGIYLSTKPVSCSIIVSLDAALSTASLAVETEMLRLLYYLEYLTQNKMIVQTRLEKNRILETFSNGLIRKYQNDTISDRQALDFPPFSTQIKIVTTPEQTLPHYDSVKKIVRDELDGSISQLPGITKSKIYLITINSEKWQSNAADPMKNYLGHISSDFPIRINPDIII